jgi:hypothetical protein
MNTALLLLVVMVGSIILAFIQHWLLGIVAIIIWGEILKETLFLE